MLALSWNLLWLISPLWHNNSALDLSDYTSAIFGVSMRAKAAKNYKGNRNPRLFGVIKDKARDIRLIADANAPRLMDMSRDKGQKG
jgi:hypothetical protein